MKYLTQIPARIFSYREIILYASDPYSEFIFCTCLQQSLFITAFCEDCGIPYRLWCQEFDFIPCIAPAQLADLENAAAVVSRRKYRALEAEDKLHAHIDYYLYDPSLSAQHMRQSNSLLALHTQVWERPLAILMCNSEGGVYLEFLRAMGLEPTLCASIDEAMWGTAYHGMQVLPPSALKAQVGKAYVLVATAAWSAAFPLLSSMGFDPDDVFLDIVRTENSRSYLLKPWMHGKNTRLIEDHLYKIMEMNGMGRRIVADLQEHGDTEYIVTGPGIGDAGIVASFCRACKEVYGYKKVVIVCYAPVEEVVRLFPDVDGVIGLGNIEFWALINYFFVSRVYDQINVHFAYCQYQNCYSEQEVADCFRRMGKPWFHAIKEDMLQLPPAASPQMLRLQGDAAAGLTERITPSNAVLLIASSVTEEYYLSEQERKRSRSFFAVLAARLKERGIEVYANAHSQVDVPGAWPLAAGLAELLNISGQLRGVVSVRCGLQEMLCLSNCNLSIIYEEPHAFYNENCDTWIMRDKMASYLLEDGKIEQIADKIANNMIL